MAPISWGILLSTTASDLDHGLSIPVSHGSSPLPAVPKEGTIWHSLGAACRHDWFSFSPRGVYPETRISILWIMYYLNSCNDFIEKYVCDTRLKWIMYVISTDSKTITTIQGVGFFFRKPDSFHAMDYHDNTGSRVLLSKTHAMLNF